MHILNYSAPYVNPVSKTHTAICILAFLLAAVPSHAQWSGSVDGSGGFFFTRPNNNEALKAALNYNADRFFVNTVLHGSHNYSPSKQDITIFDGKKEGSEYWKNEDKSLYPRVFDAGVKMDIGYRFNPADILILNAGYSFRRKTDHPEMTTERGKGRDYVSGTQLDTFVQDNHGVNVKLSYDHILNNPGSKINVNVTTSAAKAMEYNSRITDGDFYSKKKRYRTVGYIHDFDTDISASFQDASFCNVQGLKFSAGIDAPMDMDLDLYAGENRVGGTWRDSTALDQSYSYWSLSIEPYVTAEYTIDKFVFGINERVQWYSHALMDKLDEKKGTDDDTYLLDKSDWKNMTGASIAYKLNEKHRFDADYSRSIVRPDYKKLCTTWTIGKSEGEYFTGNPDLLPESRDRVRFRYTYKNSIFVTALTADYTNKRNTAEKVLEIIPDKKEAVDVKTLYTWANSQREDHAGVKLNMTADARIVKIEMWTTFNYARFSYKVKAPKNEMNYELGLSAAAMLNDKVKLCGDIEYWSPKESAFNSKGEDLIANLKLFWTVSKGFDLYAEIHDIADRELYEDTWNEELTYLKTTVTTPFHRSFVLGLKYKF